MTHKKSLEMQAELNYYKDALEIAERRISKDRKEHSERLRDRAFMILLILSSSVAFVYMLYGLANFTNWASGR